MSQQVNLYQPILRRERKVFSAGAMLQATMLAVLGLGLLGGFIFWRTVAQEHDVEALEERRDALAARVQRLEQQYPVPRESVALVTRVAELRQELAAKQRLLERFVVEEEHAGGFAGVLKALARGPVSDLWLDRIQLGGQGRIAMAGRALEAESVPRWIQGLGDEPVFLGREFGTLEIRREPAGNAVRFELTSSGEQQ